MNAILVDNMDSSKITKIINSLNYFDCFEIFGTLIILNTNTVETILIAQEIKKNLGIKCKYLRIAENVYV